MYPCIVCVYIGSCQDCVLGTQGKAKGSRAKCYLVEEEECAVDTPFLLAQRHAHSTCFQRTHTTWIHTCTFYMFSANNTHTHYYAHSIYICTFYMLSANVHMYPHIHTHTHTHTQPRSQTPLLHVHTNLMRMTFHLASEEGAWYIWYM